MTKISANEAANVPGCEHIELSKHKLLRIGMDSKVHYITCVYIVISCTGGDQLTETRVRGQRIWNNSEIYIERHEGFTAMAEEGHAAHHPCLCAHRYSQTCGHSTQSIYFHLTPTIIYIYAHTCSQTSEME